MIVTGSGDPLGLTKVFGLEGRAVQGLELRYFVGELVTLTVTEVVKDTGERIVGKYRLEPIEDPPDETPPR